MPESSNGHGGWVNTFLRMKWQAQVAAILAIPATVSGGTAGVSQFWKPDPAVAEIRDVLQEHRDESRAINATLITKLDSLNTTAGKISNAMFYNICEDSQNREWLARLGSRGQSYCQSITSDIEREFARGAYR